jgi:hypothetical protein
VRTLLVWLLLVGFGLFLAGLWLTGVQVAR